MANGTEFLRSHLGEIGAGVGGAAIGAGLGFAAGRRSGSKKSRTRKVRHNKSRKKSNSHKSKKRGRRTPHTVGKRKDTSHRRIRYTKKGQPYVILANGRARFIKKKSAKSSHKRKGGRY